jgi:hypothetical protein
MKGLRVDFTTAGNQWIVRSAIHPSLNPAALKKPSSPWRKAADDARVRTGSFADDEGQWPCGARTIA